MDPSINLIKIFQKRVEEDECIQKTIFEYAKNKSKCNSIRLVKYDTLSGFETAFHELIVKNVNVQDMGIPEDYETLRNFKQTKPIQQDIYKGTFKNWKLVSTCIMMNRFQQPHPVFEIQLYRPLHRQIFHFIKRLIR